MIEIKGTYNSAVVFSDTADESAINQVRLLLEQPFVEGAKIRLMPDIHAGAGCTIGTTMTISDKIVPNLVGVDIGCGMEVARLREKRMELSKLDAVIRERIPSGFDVRADEHRYLDEVDLEALFCKKQVDLRRAALSLGTLGGGNHFIEANRDDEGALYLVVHSGSRHLGLQVAKAYQEAAYKAMQAAGKEAADRLAEAYRAQGREREIPAALAALKAGAPAVPKDLCYLEGELFERYLHDMRIMQRFADLNRRAMMDELLRGMKLHALEQFTTIHNYIDTEAMILRKGAVSARAGERLLIPINMRDGSLICTGKGNPDWNQSAPHGAGRLMSRAAAKQAFTVSEFKRQMKDVFTTTVGKDTLDECPMAYKPMAEIVQNIAPTAAIERVIRPVYNFKAGDE